MCLSCVINQDTMTGLWNSILFIFLFCFPISIFLYIKHIFFSFPSSLHLSLSPIISLCIYISIAIQLCIYHHLCNLSLSLYIYKYISLHPSLYPYLCISLSLSLSLYQSHWLMRLRWKEGQVLFDDTLNIFTVIRHHKYCKEPFRLWERKPDIITTWAYFVH